MFSTHTGFLVRFIFGSRFIGSRLEMSIVQFCHAPRNAWTLPGNWFTFLNFDMIFMCLLLKKEVIQLRFRISSKRITGIDFEIQKYFITEFDSLYVWDTSFLGQKGSTESPLVDLHWRIKMHFRFTLLSKFTLVYRPAGLLVVQILDTDRPAKCWCP